LYIWLFYFSCALGLRGLSFCLNKRI